MKSAYFLKSPFFESFSNTVTEKNVAKKSTTKVTKPVSHRIPEMNNLVFIYTTGDQDYYYFNPDLLVSILNFRHIEKKV